jgi:hypothetical protein
VLHSLRKPKWEIAFIIGIVAASTWLLYLIDDGLGIGWPSNVLRNWQEYGLSTLHGSLVNNPGGFEAVRQPDIYYGMSPWSLGLVYFCTQIFDWTGLGTLAFHIILSLLIMWGIWSLLGKNTFALLVTVLVILCPGYGRWLKGLDPNAISVLLGIPYSAVIVGLLKQPKVGVKACLTMVLATMVYLPLNWTTAWFLTPFGVFLLFLPQVRRSIAVNYLLLTGIGSVAFVIWSATSKAGVHSSVAVTPSGSHFLGGYTWGHEGYYQEGLSNIRMFIRVAFVVTAGLFPLFLIWTWKYWWTITRWNCLNRTSLLPIGTALLVIIGMRNYFVHHPWMAAPVVIVGLVFSLALLSVEDGKDCQLMSNCKQYWLVIILAGAFFYGLTILICFRVNSINNFSVIHLVREATVRSDWIAVVKELDPVTAAISSRLSDELDRHVILVNEMKDLPRADNVVILSSHQIQEDGVKLIAQAEIDSSKAGFVFLQKITTWFNLYISRRKVGDKIDYATDYYLYRLE